MATNIKVFLRVALLCYVVTTSIGGSIDLQKGLATLQKEVENLKQQSQEEINSLVAELNELRQQSQQESSYFTRDWSSLKPKVSCTGIHCKLLVQCHILAVTRNSIVSFQLVPYPQYHSIMAPLYK